MVSPQGRREVFAEIVEIRSTIRKATEIVDFLIDKYLSEYNTSIEDAKEAAKRLWEPDSLQDDAELH